MVRFFIISLFLSWVFLGCLGFVLGTGQNLLGIRAGTIEKGAKTFYSRKKMGTKTLFLEKFFPKPSLGTR